MPNELKNFLNTSTIHTASRRLPLEGATAGSATGSTMIWTLSGMVLASCGGGGGGGLSATRFFGIQVVDGPVYGAAVYFDTDGDDDIDEYDRAALQDQHGRPLYTTNIYGEVVVPRNFLNRAYIAEVDGAVDTSTGKPLSGTFRSLPDGGLASPITTLIMERIDVAPQGSKPAPQTVLTQIFGSDAQGDPRITIDDIRTLELYSLQNRTEATQFFRSATTPEEMASYKAWVITRAAIALSEIDKSSPTYLTPALRVAAVRTLVDDITTNDDATLMAIINPRQTAGELILAGKPIAAPDPSVYIRENEVFKIGDNGLDAEALFGFFDPQGNDPDEAPSAFTGIYVSSHAGFTPHGSMAAATPVPLMYSGARLAGNQYQGPLPATLPNVPPGETFYYISQENLPNLSFDPTPNTPDMHGVLGIRYFVFDGEKWSDKATLGIRVDDVETIAEVAVFENQPLHKPIAFPAAVNLKGYHLTGGYKDNAHFRIDEDGVLRWNRPSDFENPRDIGGDNRYEIEFFQTIDEGTADEYTHRYQTVIEVKNIGTEGSYNTNAFTFSPRSSIPSADLPAQFVQHIISGRAWRMPETGPFVMTYSISEYDRAEIAKRIPNVEDFYAALEAGLKRIEDNANIRFMEVSEREHDLPYIPFYIADLPGFFAGQAFNDDNPNGQGIFIDDNRVAIEARGEAPVSVHEFGHVLGLEHPFEASRGWPGDEGTRLNLNSIMSYGNVPFLQEADIAALQFLYGMPGTNFNGIEALLVGDKVVFPDHRYDYFRPELTPGGTTEVSAAEDTFFFFARLDNYTVNNSNPRRADKDGVPGTYSELTGADANHFEFFQNGPSVLIVSNTEFDYEAPARANNEYQLDLTMHESGGNRVQTNYRIKITDLTEQDIRVFEGVPIIANLSLYSLTGPTIRGEDSDEVMIRNDRVEFKSAPTVANPMDFDGDNVYEFTIFDASISIDFDVTVFDI
jgi:hypothetical protein